MKSDFAGIAYCFMPDHLHALLEGLSEFSDLPEFVRLLKQESSYWFRSHHASSLWQRGYYEHTLRSDESSIIVARYILGNPVRAGLVEKPKDYPFLGSFVTTVDGLLNSVADGKGPT